MSRGREKRQGQGPKSGRGAGHVRIIGGDWRGRMLPIADVPGLRPSGDRGRETLFNWLQGSIYGARCADLFAGSGALGFEAASRGARIVTLVEKNRRATDVLRESARLLKAEQVTVIEGDAIEWLNRQTAGSLDVVFIDPPFESDLAGRALKALCESKCLAHDGLVYLERPRHESQGVMTAWTPVREKEVGEVRMQLLKLVDPV